MSISSTNITFMLGVWGLYTVPQQIQGFADDDVFEFDDINIAENHMGVDGKLSSGLLFEAHPQNITLQADSASNQFFDAWIAAELAQRDKYTAHGIITMPAINYSYVLTNGFLTQHSVMAGAKKVLQPRKYVITWEKVFGAPI